jgi:hypothetical protein
MLGLAVVPGVDHPSLKGEEASGVHRRAWWPTLAVLVMAAFAGPGNRRISTWRVLDNPLKRKTPNTPAIAAETLIQFVCR